MSSKLRQVRGVDMFGKKTKTWTTPGGSYPKLYFSLLEHTHIYIASPQTEYRDSFRDGFINTALSYLPTVMNFFLIDLSGTYMRIYKDLPHTLFYTDSRGSALQALVKAQAVIKDRVSAFNKDKSAKFPALWILIDGYESLYFKYKDEADNLLSHILFSARQTNVHLLVFSSYSKPHGGIDERFPAYGFLSGMTDDKIKRITGKKYYRKVPNSIIFKSYLIDFAEIELPEITDEQIYKQIDWWKNQ